MCDCAIVMFDTVQVGVLGFWGAGVVIDICAGSKGRKGRPEAQCGGLKENPRCTLTALRWEDKNSRDEFRIVLKKVMIKFQRIDQEILGPQN
jgi:hypothetical protein